MIPESFNVLYETTSLDEAKRLHRMLREEDVDSMVDDHHLPHRVMVNPDHMDWAESVYESFRNGQQSEQQPNASEEATLADLVYTQWPKCPTCDAMRDTSCPACGVSGHNFAPADTTPQPAPQGRVPGQTVSPTAEWVDQRGEPVLLMCQTCDEPFQPEFYRHCPWCGHDFGRGNADPKEEEVRTQIDVSWRALIVLAGLFGVLVAVLGFFYLVLS